MNSKFLRSYEEERQEQAMHTDKRHTAAQIEIYPGPGVEGYRSDLNAVDIHHGSDWQPAYLYKVSKRPESNLVKPFVRNDKIFCAVGGPPNPIAAAW